MLDFLALHKIHPVIAKTFDFEDAEAALAYAQKSDAVGKVVIRC